MNTLPVVIPPLTERGDDMFLLMEQFRRELNGDFRLTEPVQNFFRRHTWPGNIRELRNVVEYFIYTDHRDITMEDLPPTLLLSGDALSRPASAPTARQARAGPLHVGFLPVRTRPAVRGLRGRDAHGPGQAAAKGPGVPCSPLSAGGPDHPLRNGGAGAGPGQPRPGGSQLTPKGRELWEIGQR